MSNQSNTQNDKPQTVQDIDEIEQKSVVRNWTATRVRHLLSEEVRTYHEAHFSEERRNIFYERVAETEFD